MQDAKDEKNQVKKTISDVTIKPSFLVPKADKISNQECNVKASNSFVNILTDKFNKTLLENSILMQPQSALGTKKSMFSDMLKPAISSNTLPRHLNQLSRSQYSDDSHNMLKHDSSVQQKSPQVVSPSPTRPIAVPSIGGISPLRQPSRQNSSQIQPQQQQQTQQPIGKDKMHINLAKYEELRIKNEAQPITSLVAKGVKRMAFDYMNLLSENHGQEATKLPLLLKMNTISQQLLMNEIQICLWHALNISRPEIWSNKPVVVIEKLLINALFAKINTSTAEQAEIFKSFITHNYKEVMRNHWSEFKWMKDCDQHNWISFVNQDPQDRVGQNFLTDRKIGLQHCKQIFESLFYKVKVEKSPFSDLPPNWGLKSYGFDEQNLIRQKPYKFIDHPADYAIDYNSMVDNLEEEHLRREVFTTANENQGQLSENPNLFESQQTTPGLITPTLQGAIVKPSSRRQSLLKSMPDLAQLAKDKTVRGPRKRGPRKRREVVNQADVAAPKERRRRERVANQDDRSQKKAAAVENSSGSKGKQDDIASDHKGMIQTPQSKRQKTD